MTTTMMEITGLGDGSTEAPSQIHSNSYDQCTEIKTVKIYISQLNKQLSYAITDLQKDEKNDVLKGFVKLTSADIVNRTKKLKALLPCPNPGCEDCEYNEIAMDIPRHSEKRSREYISKTDEEIIRVPKKQNVEFQKVPARHTAKSAVVFNHTPTPSTSTENRFGVLSDMEGGDSNSDKTSTVANKIPSIFVVIKDDYKSQIAEIIGVISGEAKFKRKSGSPNEYIDVQLSSPDDHRKLTKYMTEKEIAFFALKPINQRPVKVVFKGLPIETKCEDIRTELTEKGFSIEHVVQLKRTRDKHPLPIFQIELRPSLNVMDIYSINTCCYMTVEVAKFVGRKGVNQCYRCQGFGHSSKICSIPYKCVKCGGDHESKGCAKKKGDGTAPMCANCQGPHPASFRGCSKFPKANITNTRENKDTRNRGTRHFTSNHRREGISYSNVAIPNSQAPYIHSNQTSEGSIPTMPTTSKPQENNNDMMKAILEMLNNQSKLLETLNAIMINTNITMTKTNNTMDKIAEVVQDLKNNTQNHV